MKYNYGPKKNIEYIFRGIAGLAASFFIFAPSSLYALEKLEAGRLKSETAQAGISVGMDNIAIYQEHSSIRFRGVDQSNPNYVALENIQGLATFATGASDVNNDGKASSLFIDIGTATNDPAVTSDDISLVFLTCADWAQDINILIGNINWCGKNLGSAEIRNFSLPSWHAYVGAYNGTGIDFQLGFRTRIEEIRYNYGTGTEYFGFKGVAAAASFEGDPADPSSWVPSGEMKIGDALASTPDPATIDFVNRDNGDGTSTPSVMMHLNASGSIRAESMTFGTQNFGPVAIDGIKVHSMKIELPGRGLGGN